MCSLRLRLLDERGRGYITWYRNVRGREYRSSATFFASRYAYFQFFFFLTFFSLALFCAVFCNHVVIGLYPLVGWKLPDSMKFVAEGCSQDTALILNWAKSIGLFTDVAETSHMAESCSNSGSQF